MNSLQLIDELEQLVENGTGGWLGSRLVNEAAFLSKVQQLRSALSSSQTLEFANELEHLVKGKFGFLGKRLINELEFFTKVQQLRSALSRE